METTSPPSPAPTLSYPPRSSLPKRSRVNIRLIVFLSLVALPFLILIVYPIFNYQIHSGIEHYGDFDKVDLKSLGFFSFDGVNGTIQEIPQKWRTLDGKRVQLEGFTVPLNNADGRLNEFQFVYNRQKCCFSGPPLVQERVFAYMPRGQSMPDIDYGRLTGILHVKVEKRDGVVESIYRLEVEKAEPIG